MSKSFIAFDKNGRKRVGSLGAQIGKGGEGLVYRDASEQLAIKLYQKNASDMQDKIEAMVGAQPRGQIANHRSDSDSSIVQIAWPQEMVFDLRQNFIGFSMRLVDVSKTKSLTSLETQKSRERNGIRDDYQFRVYVARNICSIVYHIHEAGHWLIDMKPDNMRLFPDSGFVCVIDSDGFCVAGNRRRFPATVVTPGYIAPEFAGLKMAIAALDERQDRFALAVVLFRLLANVHPAMGGVRQANFPADEQSRIDGRHFFIGRNSPLSEPKASVYSSLGDDTKEMFLRAFTGFPDDRPCAEEWREHVDQLTARLTTCKKVPQHFSFSKRCPWCLQERELRQLRSGRLRRTAQVAHTVQRAAPPRAAPASVSSVNTGRIKPSSVRSRASTKSARLVPGRRQFFRRTVSGINRVARSLRNVVSSVIATLGAVAVVGLPIGALGGYGYLCWYVTQDHPDSGLDWLLILLAAPGLIVFAIVAIVVITILTVISLFTGGF